MLFIDAQNETTRKDEIFYYKQSMFLSNHVFSNEKSIILIRFLRSETK